MKFTPGLVSNPLDLAGTRLVREDPSAMREILYCVQYTTFTSLLQLALCSISNSHSIAVRVWQEEIVSLDVKGE
jgi:ribosome recycling factor